MPIRVTIEILPGIRPPGGERIVSVEVGEKHTVREALLAAGFEEEEVGYLRVWREEEIITLHTQLRDSDWLRVAIPLSGG